LVGTDLDEVCRRVEGKETGNVKGFLTFRREFQADETK
jgi:hypothetical protein